MNYINIIVRIVELPVYYYFNNSLLLLKIRVKFAQHSRTNSNSILTILIWDNILENIRKYYCLNRYLLIEGYLRLANIQHQNSIKSDLMFEISIFRISILI